MESFKEQTCDFSMNYGLSPDSCTSIVFPENHKSKCQRMLEIKRLKCARFSKKQCIPKEKLLTHDQWLEKQAKCQKPSMTDEEMLQCAKKIQEVSLKHNYKKCPFINKLQTVLEMSDEHKEEALSERCSGFDELMLKYIEGHTLCDDEHEEDFEMVECLSEDSGVSEPNTEELSVSTPPTPSSPISPSTCSEPEKRKKTPRGFKKLWKQFHAICEQSTMHPFRDHTLNYSPGTPPSDLPMLYQ